MTRYWNTIFGAAALLIAGCSTPSTTTATDGVSRAVPNAQTMPADAAGRAAWLVRFITALADSGTIQSQADLLTIFPGARIVPIRHMQNAYSCGTTGQKTDTIFDLIRLDSTWFQAMPDGVAHMQYPGFTINPPGETGAPELTFSTSHNACQADRSRNNLSVLRLDNLPAFACITGTILVAQEPHVQEERITDGGIGFGYSGKIDQDTSVRAEFNGRFGGPCLISASITRTAGMGYRRWRAQYKWQTCLHRSGAGFCKAHPEFQFSYPPGPAMLSLMDAKQEQVLAECGRLDDYYEREPADGPIPPPITESPIRLQRVCPQD